MGCDVETAALRMRTANARPLRSQEYASVGVETSTVDDGSTSNTAKK